MTEVKKNCFSVKNYKKIKCEFRLENYKWNESLPGRIQFLYPFSRKRGEDFWENWVHLCRKNFEIEGMFIPKGMDKCYISQNSVRCNYLSILKYGQVSTSHTVLWNVITYPYKGRHPGHGWMISSLSGRIQSRYLWTKTCKIPEFFMASTMGSG